MHLNKLRKQFSETIFISDGFLALMNRSFRFYTALCNEVHSNLGNLLQTNGGTNFLQTEIRTKLFDPIYCKSIEKTKKLFLAESIKLEQYIEEKQYKTNFLNDLDGLKKVSDSIYELLQTHWELYKYEKSVVNHQTLIRFINRIEEIGIEWDSYLEKYLAIGKLLKSGDRKKVDRDTNVVCVQYHLPEDVKLTLERVTQLNEFLQTAFEFVVKIYDRELEEYHLEVLNIDADRPYQFILKVPEPFASSFGKFLGYLSVDVLKRETLVKFVMEVVRLEQGKEISKNVLATFQKRIAKHLNAFHPDSFISVNQNESMDSVTILNNLCRDMDQLEIQYKDLLSGGTNRLGRNRFRTPESPASTSSQTSQKRVVAVKMPPLSTNSPSSKGEQKELRSKEKEPSNVKLNVPQKEHIGFLTS